MFQEGLVALLKADAGVSALCSHFFAVEASDDPTKYPCVSYALVGGTSDHTLDGKAPNFSRLELSAHSLASYAEADKIRAALMAAVDGWRATLPNGFRVENAELVNPGTDFVSVQGVFRCLCEFRVFFNFPTA
jgi:hypothetical protein